MSRYAKLDAAIVQNIADGWPPVSRVARAEAERPILFNDAMVRTILAGTKTQTRRIVKPAKDRDIGCHMAPCELAGEVNGGNFRNCPFGQLGDLLWVREAHWWFKDEPDHSCGYYPPKLTAEDVEFRSDGDDGRKVWRPSIHMPRWASRITLEITGVRVERLQDISSADAIAEGVNVHPDHRDKPSTSIYSPVQAYRDLWESINGPGSWDANPWVWCISFRRIDASHA